MDRCESTERTPGPWTVERGNAGSNHPLFVVAPDRDGLRPWCDADAHLIAAAPELLAALKETLDLLRLVSDYSPAKFDSTWAFALKAIAKAEGRELGRN